jgi:hypothetical protein
VTGLNISSTGVKEAVLNVSGLNTLSTGAKVVGLNQDQVMMQDIKPCNTHLKLNTVQSYLK